jgi:acetylornithine/N-succinyldiaminopimelate aminotransferase
MAVGNAVLDVVLAPGFLEHVNKVANYLRQQLASVVDRNGTIVEDVRGQGLLLGLKCKVPQNDLIGALRDRGLLTVAAGDNVVRILPPLIVTEEQVREAVGIIHDACQSLSHVPSKDAAK